MATNNSEFLRRRMKELREKNGLTMDEMAKRLGYEQKSTISRVESGKQVIPPLKSLRKNIVKRSAWIESKPNSFYVEIRL